MFVGERERKNKISRERCAELNTKGEKAKRYMDRTKRDRDERLTVTRLRIIQRTNYSYNLSNRLK